MTNFHRMDQILNVLLGFFSFKLKEIGKIN